MRIAFFLLLIANLAFLAWSQWIDAPQPAPANEAYERLPRLKLVNELSKEDTRPSSGNARKTALEATALAPAAHCVSIGPFDDQASATRGASQLREKGLVPRQRVQEGEISKGFWVYIGGLKTDHDVDQVLHTLQQSHIDDAQPMPDTGDVHRVSVGLFSERDRADRRAQSVQKLGLQPEVAERKLPTTAFWMDMDIPQGTANPDAPQNLQLAPCPEGAPRPDDAAPLTPVPGNTPTPFRTKVAGASKVP